MTDTTATNRETPPGHYTLEDFTYNLTCIAVRALSDEDDDLEGDDYWRAHQYAESHPFTKLQIAQLCAETIDALGVCDCLWCGVDTNRIGEFYMVDDAIWARYGPRMGCLCIGCLEDRMGRRLRPDDFKLRPDADLNTPSPLRMSERLQDRLGVMALPGLEAGTRGWTP